MSINCDICDPVITTVGLLTEYTLTADSIWAILFMDGETEFWMDLFREYPMARWVHY